MISNYIEWIKAELAGIDQLVASEGESWLDGYSKRVIKESEQRVSAYVAKAWGVASWGARKELVAILKEAGYDPRDI